MKKLLVVGALLAAAGGAYLYLEPQAAHRWLAGTPLDPQPRVTTAYQWRNARGEWQITDHPPPAGTAYKRLQVRGDVNVFPLVPKSQSQ